MSAKEHLQGERFYLHPGGLSKSRRKIFESWILKEGGEVVTMAEEGDGRHIVHLGVIIDPT